MSYASKTMEELTKNWQSAEIAESESYLDEALSELKQLKILDQSLKDYETYKSKRCLDTLKTNLELLLTSLSAVMYERITIDNLDDLYEVASHMTGFVEENPSDIVTEALKQVLVCIDKYLSTINKPLIKEKFIEYHPKYKKPYYKYYKQGEYGKYYELDEAELLSIPYDQLHPKLYGKKMQLHAKRASELLRQLHGIIEKPSGIPTSVEGLEREAIEKLKERKKTLPRHEELSQIDDFPEALRLARLKQEQELAKPESEGDRAYRIAKEGSKRIREQLHKQGIIQLEEE